VNGVLPVAKTTEANGTQASLNWDQINWQKVEKTVLRLQHRIFMAKVKGDAKGMESLQRLLVSSCAAKLLAVRKVGEENSGRKTPALHGLEDLFHEWSLVGGNHFICETVETFPEPPKGYRKCKPENAASSLQGPTKPRKTSRKEPPKIYGPYPDGSWRTLRLVVNDERTRTNPALRKDPQLGDLRLIRYADDFVVLARSRRQLETVVFPSCGSFSKRGGYV
jgi:hypothetical protein